MYGAAEFVCKAKGLRATAGAILGLFRGFFNIHIVIGRMHAPVLLHTSDQHNGALPPMAVTKERLKKLADDTLAIRQALVDLISDAKMFADRATAEDLRQGLITLSQIHVPPCYEAVITLRDLDRTWEANEKAKKHQAKLRRARGAPKRETRMVAGKLAKPEDHDLALEIAEAIALSEGTGPIRRKSPEEIALEGINAARIARGQEPRTSLGGGLPKPKIIQGDVVMKDGSVAHLDHPDEPLDPSVPLF